MKEPSKRSKSRSKKSEQPKIILAVVLAIVLLLVVVSQMGSNDSGEAQNELANVPQTPSSPSLRQKNTSIERQASAQPPKLISQPPAFELPRQSHDEIASKNPFLEVKATPANELVGQKATSESTNSDTENLEPKSEFSAVYVTPEGATALIDGQLVPIYNPLPAIDSIKANWGNDFSPSTDTTE